MFKSFASDNNAPVHPEIMRAIEQANRGDCVGYGDDPYTLRAKRLFEEIFDRELDVAFVLTGTGANVLSLATVLKPFEGVLCARSAHINVDECGAPERFTGCKIIPLQHECGKVSVESIREALVGVGIEHHVQPRLVSITQPTEFGCLYTKDEIGAIAEFCHANNLILHMDGSRIANAAVGLSMEFKEFTSDLGVDVLSFGGTKNGLMMGEAVVFFNRELSCYLKYHHKQTMQLFSKMRYVSAQFIAYLSDELWHKCALQANEAAGLLKGELEKMDGIEILYPVETNMIFARLSRGAIDELLKHTFFYVVDEHKNVVRWVTSYNTTKEDVKMFAGIIRKSLENSNLNN